MFKYESYENKMAKMQKEKKRGRPRVYSDRRIKAMFILDVNVIDDLREYAWKMGQSMSHIVQAMIQDKINGKAAAETHPQHPTTPLNNSENK